MITVLLKYLFFFQSLNLFPCQILESIKKISANAPILKIRFTTYIGRISSIEFSPPLACHLDYDIVPKKYKVPEKYQQYYQNSSDNIQLQLRDGKSWAKLGTEDWAQVPLYITRFTTLDDDKTIEHAINDPIRIATIVKPRSTCPIIKKFPGASVQLMSYVHEILNNCAGVRIYQSKRLHRRRWNSFSLLELQPALILVDGSDQLQEGAARSVDAFLAAHSVLEVVWEPIYPSEPSWWVLVPRPSGMPGHLFAMIDSVQWKHVSVATHQAYRKAYYNCTFHNAKSACVAGCPNTVLKRFMASGYNADTGTVAGVLRKTVFLNRPFQVAPLELGWRAVPPLWGSTVGWSYTFRGCASNFLDCFFLDHSPCPPIEVDVQHRLTNEAVRRRGEEPQAWMTDWGLWYKELTDSANQLPKHSVGGFISGLPSNHVFYTYLFRPQYHVRREVQRRVESFGLDPDSCAVMHVRRGDAVMHQGQGRAYIAIHTYLEAARPLMDALGLDTVLLLTDSQTAVEEALRCEEEFPRVCKGIRWRYIDKKRWRGAEGGWENPFPSGNATEEFLIVQNEFSVAQQCSLAILGNSGYGNLVYAHQCCSFPLHPRGQMPTRCVCPPKVEVKQYDFNCEHGNKLLCGDKDVGGNIHKPLNSPENMLGANYSFTRGAFKDDPEIKYQVPGENPLEFRLHELKSLGNKLSRYIQLAVSDVCKYGRGSEYLKICSSRA